jgi:CcmD family protein
LQPTATDRSTEFVAVEGGEETTSAGTLLVVAYVVMWALLLGFLLMTWRRLLKIEGRLGELDRALARGAPPDPRP